MARVMLTPAQTRRLGCSLKLTEGTTNIIAAMKEKGVSRVAAMTSIGAGDSENQAPFFFKVMGYARISYRWGGVADFVAEVV